MKEKDMRDVIRSFCDDVDFSTNRGYDFSSFTPMVAYACPDDFSRPEPAPWTFPSVPDQQIFVPVDNDTKAVQVIKSVLVLLKAKHVKSAVKIIEDFLNNP